VVERINLLFFLGQLEPNVHDRLHLDSFSVEEQWLVSPLRNCRNRCLHEQRRARLDVDFLY